MAEYRAELWRAFDFAVALLPAAAGESAGAPEFRPADTRNEDYSTLQALSHSSDLIEATSQPLEPIRKGE